MRTTTLTGHVTDKEHQPDLEGNMFPVGAEVDVASLEVTGSAPERAAGLVHSQRPEPAVPADRPLPHVRRRRHAARHHVRGRRRRRTAIAGSVRAGCQAEADLGRARVSRARRRHELPRPVAGRRCRAGEEPRQHPHHPPRRPATSRCGRAGCRPRSPRRSTPSASTTSTGSSAGGDDGAPAPRPAHRRDVLLRLLGVRARHPLLRRRRATERSCTARSSTCRRR